jgi:hypothetical protein
MLLPSAGLKYIIWMYFCVCIWVYISKKPQMGVVGITLSYWLIKTIDREIFTTGLSKVRVVQQNTILSGHTSKLSSVMPGEH